MRLGRALGPPNGKTVNMNDVSAWKQLQLFEKRGDLAKQAEVLQQVLGKLLPPQALPDVLKMAQERALTDAERQPPELLRVDQGRQVVQGCDSRSGTPLRECQLHKEPGLIPPEQLSWSPLGQIACTVLEVRQQKLTLVQQLERWTPAQAGLLVHQGYAYLNFNPTPGVSWFCRGLSHSQMPLEPVRSLPLDLSVSARHPFFAVADRGAGKLHLIQRDSFRLLRSWPIVPAPNKKGLGVGFHPDGKRVFVTGHQPGLMVLIDRGMAQKRLSLPDTHILGNLVVANKGDLISVLAIQPETRRPELWQIDTEKFKLQNRISLDGEAFSSGADARDLLELTPDGQYAVAMVSRNQPALFTPALLLVDLASGQTVDQLVLKPEHKPVNLAFPARSLVNPRLRLLPMLLHGGYGLSEDQLKQIFGVERLDG